MGGRCVQCGCGGDVHKANHKELAPASLAGLPSSPCASQSTTSVSLVGVHAEHCAAGPAAQDVAVEALLCSAAANDEQQVVAVSAQPTELAEATPLAPLVPPGPLVPLVPPAPLVPLNSTSAGVAQSLSQLHTEAPEKVLQTAEPVGPPPLEPLSSQPTMPTTLLAPAPPTQVTLSAVEAPAEPAATPVFTHVDDGSPMEAPKPPAARMPPNDKVLDWLEHSALGVQPPAGPRLAPLVPTSSEEAVVLEVVRDSTESGSVF